MRAASKGDFPWDSSTLRTAVPGVAPCATETGGGRVTEVARPVFVVRAPMQVPMFVVKWNPTDDVRLLFVLPFKQSDAAEHGQ